MQAVASGFTGVAYFDACDTLREEPFRLTCAAGSRGDPSVAEENCDFDAQIKDLQFHVAHQQRLLEQLNDVVVQHTQQILRLERAMLRYEEQLKTLREQRKEPFDPNLEKPPHY